MTFGPPTELSGDVCMCHPGGYPEIAQRTSISAKYRSPSIAVDINITMMAHYHFVPASIEKGVRRVKRMRVP